MCRLYIYIHTFVTLILQKMYWDVLHSDVFWNKIRSKTLFQGLVAGVASRCTLVACRQRRFGRFGFTEKMDLANLEISAKKKRSRTRSRRSRIWRCKRSLRTSHWRWSTGVVGIFTGLETKKTIENWRMKVMKAQHIFSFFFGLSGGFSPWCRHDPTTLRCGLGWRLATCAGTADSWPATLRSSWPYVGRVKALLWT